jgi:hypothetical protein
MAAEKCKNCKFRKDTECRRLPPIFSNPAVAQLADKPPSAGVWPEVENDGWCGEWKSKEE